VIPVNPSAAAALVAEIAKASQFLAAFVSQVTVAGGWLLNEWVRLVGADLEARG
jgi:hypothetical protein